MGDFSKLWPTCRPRIWLLPFCMASARLCQRWWGKFLFQGAASHISVVSRMFPQDQDACPNYSICSLQYQEYLLTYSICTSLSTEPRTTVSVLGMMYDQDSGLLSAMVWPTCPHVTRNTWPDTGNMLESDTSLAAPRPEQLMIKSASTSSRLRSFLFSISTWFSRNHL